MPVPTSNNPSSSVLTEINLNENNNNTLNPHQIGSTAIASNLDTVNLAANANLNEPIPPICELPSYNEAIRIKKLEANGDLPPSYFPGGPYDPEQNDHRITIDAIDV